MDHTKPLEGSGGLEMELKGNSSFRRLFRLLFDLIDAYLTLFGLTDPYLALFGPNKGQ